MKPFFDDIFTQTPVAEAKGKTQEIYALLDAVVQAVLTDRERRHRRSAHAGRQGRSGAPRQLVRNRRSSSRRRRRGETHSRSRHAPSGLLDQHSRKRPPMTVLDEAPPLVASERTITPHGARRPRRGIRGWVRRGGIANLLFALPLIAGVRRLQLVADRAVVRDELPEDEPDHLDLGRLRQLRQRAERPAARDRGAQHPLLRGARTRLRVPAAAAARRADERGAPRQGRLQRTRLPPGRDPAGRRRAAVEVLLRRQPDRRLQHDPRLGRHPAAALDPAGVDARCRPWCSRRPGRRPADRSSSTSLRCSSVPPELYDAAEVDGASIWRKIWHVTLPQLRGRAVRDADPAGHRDGAGVPRAVPVHRWRSEQRDRHGAAADLPVRVPEQPRRRLRRGDSAQRDARDRARRAVDRVLPSHRTLERRIDAPRRRRPRHPVGLRPQEAVGARHDDRSPTCCSSSAWWSPASARCSGSPRPRSRRRRTASRRRCCSGRTASTGRTCRRRGSRSRSASTSSTR